MGILEDREYELDTEDFVNRCKENRYIFVVDILKKAAMRPQEKDGLCPREGYKGV